MQESCVKYFKRHTLYDETRIKQALSYILFFCVDDDGLRFIPLSTLVKSCRVDGRMIMKVMSWISPPAGFEPAAPWSEVGIPSHRTPHHPAVFKNSLQQQNHWIATSLGTYDIVVTKDHYSFQSTIFDLTHLSPAPNNRGIGKQYRPRSERGVYTVCMKFRHFYKTW